MNVQQLSELIAGPVASSRAPLVPVLLDCDGVIREIQTVEIRTTHDRRYRPRRIFVLIVADGPTGIQEPSATTTRSPRP